MRVTIWIRCLVALVASTGLSTFAADNCSGTWNNVVTSSSTFEAAKGHSIPDGKNQLAGACIRKAADGSSYGEAWELSPGAERGTWKMIGGTGKFAGKKNSGWFQTQFLEGKLVFGVWGGTCEQSP